MNTKLKILTALSIAEFLDGKLGPAHTVTNPGFKDLVGVDLGDRGAKTTAFTLNPGEAIAIKIDDVETVRSRLAKGAQVAGHPGYALSLASANSNGDLAVAVTATPDNVDFTDAHNAIARVIPSAGAGALKLGVAGAQPWRIEDVHGKFYVIANIGAKPVKAMFQGTGAPV